MSVQKLFVLCLIYCLALTSRSQAQTVHYGPLLSDIEQKILHGNTRALRDLGSLLSREEIRPEVLALLDKYTLFTTKECNVKCTDDATAFMDFFYKNSDRIRWEPLVHAFIISPLEKRRSEHILRPASFVSGKDPQTLLNDYIYQYKSLKHQGSTSAEKILLDIAELKIREGNDFLAEILTQHILGWERDLISSETMVQLCLALTTTPKRAYLDIYLQLIEKQLATAEALSESAALLTNHMYTGLNNPLQFSEHYRSLLDKYPTIEEVHLAGYAEYLSFKPIFFSETVDYYGRVLLESSRFPWLRQNIIHELLGTNHPRAFVYLAAHMLHIAKTPNYNFNYFEGLLQAITTKTGLQIGVKNNEGIFVFDEIDNWDVEAFENYLFFLGAIPRQLCLGCRKRTVYPPQ